MDRRPRSLPEQDTPPRRLRRVPLHKRPLVVGLGSAGIGFCCGALFWHAIGFWSFVSEVVLRGPQDVAPTVKEARASEPLSAAQRPTGTLSPTRIAVGGRPPSVARAHLTCSVAYPDSDQGDVHVFPCTPGTGPAPAKPLAKKGDLLAVAAPQAVPPPIRPVDERAAVARTNPDTAWTPVIRGSTR